MQNLKHTHLNYKVFIIQILLVLIIQANLKTINAQKIQKDLLLGTWVGSITTVYDGGKDETPITVSFETGSTVTLTMLVPRKAKYAVSRNTIRITFDSDQNEPLTLDNVLLNKNSLTAEGHFPSDQSFISSRIILSRATNDRVVESKSQNGVCGKTDIRPNLQKLFDKYQIRCPINVLENSRWYSFPFLKGFLDEVLQEAQTLNQQDSLQTAGSEASTRAKRTLGYVFKDYDGIVIGVFSEQSKQTIEKILTPILIDPQNLRFSRLDLLAGIGASYSFRVDELKPKFRNGSLVNTDLVWTEVINAALPLGINLDAKTIKQNESMIAISQTVPRRIIEPGGYIYFEYVTVTMSDPSSRAESVIVEVKSKIIKRKGYSSSVRSVDCDLDTAKSSTCSEQPYMKAIIKALTDRKD